MRSQISVLCPCDHLDRIGQLTVTGDLAELVPVGADHVGKRMRVSSVALRARHAATLTEPSRLQRIDREHLISGRDQCPHPGTSIGLDAHRHLVAAGLAAKDGEMLAEQRMQPGHPGYTLRQPRLGQPAPRLVLDLDVMVILRPVIPNEQHNGPPVTRHLLLDQQPAGEPPAA